MGIRTSKSAINRFRQDELAKQLVLRWQINPAVLSDKDTPAVNMLRNMADDLIRQQDAPHTLAQWIAMALFFPNHPRFNAMKVAAKARSQPGYTQALHWLELIHAKQNEQPND